MASRCSVASREVCVNRVSTEINGENCRVTVGGKDDVVGGLLVPGAVPVVDGLIGVL